MYVRLRSSLSIGQCFAQFHVRSTTIQFMSAMRIRFTSICMSSSFFIPPASFGEKKIASNFDYRSVGKCFSLICSPVVVVVAVVEATSTEWLVQATAAYPKPNLKSDLCYSDRLSSGHSSCLPLSLTHTTYLSSTHTILPLFYSIPDFQHLLEPQLANSYCVQ